MKFPSKHCELPNGSNKFREFANELPVINDSTERNMKIFQDIVGGSSYEELSQDLSFTMESNRKGERPKYDQKLGSQVQIKRKQVIATLTKSKSIQKLCFFYILLLTLNA